MQTDQVFIKYITDPKGNVDCECKKYKLKYDSKMCSLVRVAHILRRLLLMLMFSGKSIITE